MSDSSPLLNLPYIQPAQAQKHVTHNEALRTLDALVQLSVLTQGNTPDTPQTGARYIVGTDADGAWANRDNNVAVYAQDGWAFYIPSLGWQAYVLDTDQQVVWDGTAWRAPGRLDQALQVLGVNTTADANNRFAVASPATLLTHEGADHRLKINKATPADTASMVFQSGFTGHAEMGLTGGTDFTLRVSPDGTTFADALSADANTGTLSAPAGIRFGADTLANYETGTWTPQLMFGGSDTGVTYTLQYGDYIRIGQFVMLQCGITLSSKGTATGAVTVNNMPFDADPNYYPGTLTFISGGNDLSGPQCRAIPGKRISLFNTGTSGLSDLTDDNFTNNANFKLTLVHRV